MEEAERYVFPFSWQSLVHSDVAHERGNVQANEWVLVRLGLPGKRLSVWVCVCSVGSTQRLHDLMQYYHVICLPLFVPLHQLASCCGKLCAFQADL